MAALSGPKPIASMAQGKFAVPVKGATTIYQGALVCLDASGFAIPGALATGLVAIGIADDTVANAGADGAKTITVTSSATGQDFLFANDGTNAVTAAHVGRTVYVMDDQTVRSLATGASAAGICTRVSSAGVHVRIGV